MRPSRESRRDGRMPVESIGDSGQAGRNPAVSNISSGVPNATDATITWDTDIASDSTVFWGLTAAYAGASSPIFSPTLVTSHSVQITGLTTATTYHYSVRSRSTATGGYSTSNDATFITA